MVQCNYAKTILFNLSRIFTSLSIEVLDIYFATSCLLTYIHYYLPPLQCKIPHTLLCFEIILLKVVNESSFFKNTAVQNNVEKYDCYNSTTKESSTNDGVLNDQSHARDVIEDKQKHSKSYEIMSLRSV